MSKKEIDKFEVISSLIAEKINGTEAAKQLHLSVRQIRRLKGKVDEKGAQGLIHGNRNKESNRKIKDDELEKLKEILQNEYYYFGPTFASEKLDEVHNIQISKETTRKIMIDLKLWKTKPRKTAKNKHFWRPRKDNPGEMQQFDGSFHVWFGTEECCLLLSIDDATGNITHAEFADNEGIEAVFNFWLKYFDKNGKPLSIYLDKFSTYKINHKNAVDNKDFMTQFQRAMGQIGIKLISANSPEAKGRVERMFGTLQDRLVKELRLANITEREEANKFLIDYLPKINDKFSVIPNKKTDLHKPISKNLKKKLPQIFSIQKERKVLNDYTIMFENQFFQLEEIQPTTVYKKDTVIVEKHLDYSIKINLKGHYLNYKVLPERPKKQNIPVVALSNQKSSWKPPINHPWRKQPLCFSNRCKVNKNTNS